MLKEETWRKKAIDVEQHESGIYAFMQLISCCVIRPPSQFRHLCRPRERQGCPRPVQQLNYVGH
jgi:hypothetical protein